MLAQRGRTRVRYIRISEGRATAARHDVPVTGVVGILLRVSAQGDLDLETELDALREAGFWIADALSDRALEMDAE